MQFTQRPTIGGRAWLSLRLASVDQEKALVAWANTSLGALLYWWHANKQQAGRGSIGKVPLDTLSVCDVTALSAKQLRTAVAIFDAMCKRDLLPLHQVDRDAVRHELDAQFLRDVLKFPADALQPSGPVDLLRRKLAREPSIRGQKSE
jgi:hypothetical protein